MDTCIFISPSSPSLSTNDTGPTMSLDPRYPEFCIFSRNVYQPQGQISSSRGDLISSQRCQTDAIAANASVRYAGPAPLYHVTSSHNTLWNNSSHSPNSFFFMSVQRSKEKNGFLFKNKSFFFKAIQKKKWLCVFSSGPTTRKYRSQSFDFKSNF